MRVINAYRALSGDSVLEESVLDRPDFLKWRPALDQAEAGDLSAFNEALRVLKNPYSPDPECDLYAKTPSEDEQCFTSFCGT